MRRHASGSCYGGNGVDVSRKQVYDLWNALLRLQPSDTRAHVKLVRLQRLTLAVTRIPLAGGPFNWVAILAPPSCKKFLSYMAGWFTIINWQTLVVGCAYGTASQIQGLVALTHPTYTPQLWQATLMSYGISLFAVFVVTYLGRQFPRIEAMLLVFYIMTFFGVMITLAYLAPHRTASEVFTVFQNLGGWPTQSLSFFVGWITSVGSFLGECIILESKCPLTDFDRRRWLGSYWWVNAKYHSTAVFVD